MVAVCEDGLGGNPILKCSEIYVEPFVFGEKWWRGVISRVGNM
jgi:hypothetical protein